MKIFKKLLNLFKTELSIESKEWEKPVDIKGEDKINPNTDDIFFVFSKLSANDQKKVFGIFDTLEQAKQHIANSEQMKLKAYVDEKLPSRLRLSKKGYEYPKFSVVEIIGKVRWSN